MRRSVKMWNGNRAAAVRYLLDASKAPASEELAYHEAPAAERLVKRLLKDGVAESIMLDPGFAAEDEAVFA